MKIRLTLLLTTLLALALILTAGSSHLSVASQTRDDQKMITLATLPSAPTPRRGFVEFADLKVDGLERFDGEAFEAGPDWVKDLSFKVRNTSGKPIIFIQVNVNFPETHATGNLMSYTINFGVMPGSKATGGKPFLLESNEAIEVALASEIQKIAKFVGERRSLASINKVQLEIGFVVLNDKTAWSAGTFLRQDPNNPTRWLPIPIGLDN